MIEPTRSPKLRAWHLDRSAFVYVRQSTPQQVSDHQESTARQYALVDRAVALGWTRDRVTTIDEDLGKSGQSIEGRPGFQRLLAEVALDHVGLILGLEMSRLARSNRDLHQLLELCARCRVLLADADAIYDPADHNDRLLLGLHGMMSEAELHVLKERMYQGKLNKARRGALMGTPPIGYIRLASGEWAIDPDEQVQATVRLIFDRFDREETLHGLLRYLVHHGVLIPVRSSSGPNRGELEWRRPNRTTLANLLHHPSCAGAYRFGHREVDPRRKQPGRPSTGKRARRPEDCLVLIRDRLPPYITWGRFEANLARLEANRARHDRPGAPRQGASLLGGLLRCGRCGRRMIVLYSGPRGHHAYHCTRNAAGYGEPLGQSLSGPALDELIAGRVLAAVEPAALEASLAAVTGIERERAELARHRRLRRERAACEVDRAARQYQACEPDNRLVGRELERRWEEALRARGRLEEEHERWQRTAPGRLSPDDQRAIRSLAGDLPAVWRAATTTPADRQRIVRLLVERVRVVVDKASERVDVELSWVGGLVESHVLSRPVRRYDLRAEYLRLVASLRAWCGEGLSTATIAERLNEAGFRPPKRADRFNRGMVQRLLGRLGLAHRRPHGSRSDLGRDEYRPGGLSQRLGVGRDTIRRWIRDGWVTSGRDAEVHHVIWADSSELARLGEIHALPRTWANEGRLAELARPKPRPERSDGLAWLTPSRAIPPRLWTALWLEHRGDVQQAQGVRALGQGPDGRGTAGGVGRRAAVGPAERHPGLVRPLRLPDRRRQASRPVGNSSSDGPGRGVRQV